MNNLFDLRGKKALVTGGARGIGFSCARALGEAGASILLADMREAELREAKVALESEGISVATFMCDISESESVQDLSEKVRQTGGTDIFVNSAAMIDRKPLLEMTDEEWSRIIITNLNGAYYLGKNIGKFMVEQGRGGRIIYIVSTGAFRASENYGAYSASKAGVVMLMKTLALELAPYGILCNALAPTATDTKFVSDYYAANPGKREKVAKNHPLGRLAIPEDYMGTIVYLSSEASAFVTGTVLTVDGGKTAR